MDIYTLPCTTLPPDSKKLFFFALHINKHINLIEYYATDIFLIFYHKQHTHCTQEVSSQRERESKDITHTTLQPVSLTKTIEDSDSNRTYCNDTDTACFMHD